MSDKSMPLESAKQRPMAHRNHFDRLYALKQWIYKFIPASILNLFRRFDRKVDGAASFFVKHYGKTRFMVAMSKKAQYLGIEDLFLKSPKAFIYFFIFYLVRDTILYIVIPIFFAKMTS